jgi:hypothetical protein
MKINKIIKKMNRRGNRSQVNDENVSLFFIGEKEIEFNLSNTTFKSNRMQTVNDLKNAFKNVLKVKIII